MSLISVIIPVYNKEKYISKSLKSVLAQTYSNWELILINDGSTDSSEQIILDIQEKEPRIKYIKQHNQGVSAARNTGIKHARGDYITFLDADDVYDSLFLEKMVNKIQDSDVCYCGHYFVHENGHKTKARMTFIEGDIIEEYFLNKCTPHTNSWLIKKDFIMRNNLNFDTELNWGEDMLFFAQLLTLAINVEVEKNFLTNYTLNVEDSLSTHDINKVDKEIAWLNKYVDFLKKNSSDQVRNKSILDAINFYRLPALIIYRFFKYKKIFNNKENLHIFDKHRHYIRQLKFNNGLRSFKLFFYNYLLLIYIHCKRLRSKS